MSKRYKYDDSDVSMRYRDDDSDSHNRQMDKGLLSSYWYDVILVITFVILIGFVAIILCNQVSIYKEKKEQERWEAEAAKHNFGLSLVLAPRESPNRKELTLI